MARSAKASPSKDLVKDAVREALLEQRDFLQELFAEVLEDLALAKAIRKGKKSKPAFREEVLSSRPTRK
jgi:hypothetical protein